MKLDLYQVDAFADHVFRGNPAAVCPLDSWLEDEVLQQIAIENNLSETAYFKKNENENENENGYDLRWFTPAFEIDLCGHATLASAHVIFNHMKEATNEITFYTKSGPLIVSRDGDFLCMDFPSRPPKEIQPPKELILGLGVEPKEVWISRDIMAIFDRESDVAQLQPDFHMLSAIDAVGIIASAPGDTVDFVSRFFAPRAGVNEDPVTGSAHSTLIPFWSNILGKTSLVAHQISKRGGELLCELKGDRVVIKGKAVTYLTGSINI